MMRVIDIMAAEYVLRFCENGSTAVLIRTVLVSAPMCALAAGISDYTASEKSLLAFDASRLREVIHDHLAWFGAITAGVYIALQSRFASQWQYLADVYNQIMQAKASDPPDGDTDRMRYFALWEAGYIEDIERLHMLRKSMFKTIVQGMLERPEVVDALQKSHPDGRMGLEKIAKCVDHSL